MLGLLLPVRQDLYAVPVEAVEGVLDVGPDMTLTPLPGAAATILGLVNVRGQVLPVLDTAGLLGLPPLGRAECAAIALVRVRRGTAALVASAVPRTAMLGEALGPSPMATASARHRVGHEVATLLDVEATLAPERIA